MGDFFFPLKVKGFTTEYFPDWKASRHAFGSFWNMPYLIDLGANVAQNILLEWLKTNLKQCVNHFKYSLRGETKR